MYSIYKLTEPNKRYGCGNVYYVIAENEVEATKVFCKNGFNSSDFKAELFDIQMILGKEESSDFNVICNFNISKKEEE